jgi:hypothetical protein
MRSFKDIALAGLVVAATLLSLEGALRLAHVRFTASLYTQDSVRGYALRPNAEGWATGENETYVRINSDGMRDRERSVTAEPGAIRVAVIGSSDVEAGQVPLDETFEALMETELSRAIGRKVEVLNFGVGGYTLAQQYLTLHDHVWKYRPRIVLLSFSMFNVLQNTRALCSGELDTPFFVYRRDQLVLDRPRPIGRFADGRRLRLKNIASDWMNHSDLLSLANAARLGLRRWLRTMWRDSSSNLRAADLPPDYIQTWEFFDPRDASHPVDPRLQEAWAVNDSLIRLMRDNADQHGAEFWVVVSPLDIQIHPDLMERAKFQRRLGIASLSESDHRLEDFAKSEGIHTLILAPILGEYAVEHNEALCGFWNTPFNYGHFNEEGHRVVAHAISDALLGQSVVFRPSP